MAETINSQLSNICIQLPFNSEWIPYNLTIHKLPVRTFQMSKCGCYSTSNIYHIYPQLRNSQFAVAKYPNKLSILPWTYTIYTIGSETAESRLQNIQIYFLFHSKHIPYIPPVRKLSVRSAPESILYQFEFFDRCFTSMYVWKSWFIHVECQYDLMV